MNKNPIFFDDIWKQHEISYYTFNNYKFINDLSLAANQYNSIILLFEFNGKYILRGYRDGIIFPNFKYIDIENIHTKKRKQKIQKIFDYIIDIFNNYRITDTKIYQDPRLCKKMGYSLFNLIDLKQFKLKYKLEMYFEKSPNKEIISSVKNTTRTILNKYVNIEPFQVYCGNINDDIFNSFIDKHFRLAGKKTKSKQCWSILKQLIKEKKALLLVANNNYILFFISSEYSYYAINACTKRDNIVSYLLFEGMKWLEENNYKFILHFGTFKNSIDNIKIQNIANFKKSFCNKIFTQYYLEK